VQVVARLAGEKERNNKSAHPEDQDRHLVAYRQAGDKPHLDVLGIIRRSLSLPQIGTGADLPPSVAEAVYEAAKLARHVVAQVPHDVASDTHASPHRLLRDLPHLTPLALVLRQS
jgi:hypothetical protein